MLTEAIAAKFRRRHSSIVREHSKRDRLCSEIAAPPAHEIWTVLQNTQAGSRMKGRVRAEASNSEERNPLLMTKGESFGSTP